MKNLEFSCTTKEQKKRISLLSLYSGIGAFEKSLKNIGLDYKLVNFCEIDNYASLSYSLLHDVPEKLNLGDITKVDENVLPQVDMITYGFPCQSFSVAGKRLGFEDKRTGNLFFESMRIAKKCKPNYLIAENVKGLIGHNGGGTLRTVINTLNSLGYNNYYKVLNSINFDIPQNRERVFIVSIKKEIDTGDFQFPEGTHTNKTVEDFLDVLNQNRHINSTLKPYLDTKYHKVFKSNNGIKKVFDGNAQGYFTSDYTGKRLYSVQGISPTLTTNGGIPVFIEIGSTLNGLERLRLQGFTDEDYYKLKDRIPENQIKKQAGNSITVNVIQAILKELLIKQPKGKEE